jgi:hypothetical protein
MTNARNVVQLSQLRIGIQIIGDAIIAAIILVRQKVIENGMGRHLMPDSQPFDLAKAKELCEKMKEPWFVNNDIKRWRDWGDIVDLVLPMLPLAVIDHERLEAENKISEEILNVARDEIVTIGRWCAKDQEEIKRLNAEIAAKNCEIHKLKYEEHELEKLNDTHKRIKALEALLGKAKEAMIEERAMRIQNLEHEPYQAMKESESQLKAEYPWM